MTLDVPTLFFVSTLISLLMAVWVGLMALGKPRNDSLWSWFAALACYCAGNMLVALRDASTPPPLAIIVVANSTYALALALMLVALRRFQDAPLNRWHVLLPVLAAPLVLGGALAISAAARVYATLLVYGGQILLLLWTLRDRAHPIAGRGRFLLQVAYAVLLLILVGRTGLVAGGWIEPANLIRNSPIQAIIFTVLSCAVLSLSLGFVYLSMERAEQRYREMAMSDVLTGLPNRRAITEELERCVSRARRDGELVGVVLLDIDHFKRVNDSFGHQAGDVVLRSVAQAVRSRLRGHDQVGRFGGEEFLVVLPGADLNGALAAAESLRQTVESSPVRWGAQSIAVTVSVGVRGGIVTAAETADTLVGSADAAMYQAKQSGRNRVCAAGDGVKTN
ncbi:MAG: GGDEF domain-containing protein [Paucibacter sp.]|nr:GGDEF domain-containing protein [Roseateles sp.]